MTPTAKPIRVVPADDHALVRSGIEAMLATIEGVEYAVRKGLVKAQGRE